MMEYGRNFRISVKGRIEPVKVYAMKEHLKYLEILIKNFEKHSRNSSLKMKT